MAVSFRAQQATNQRKTWALLAAMFLVVALAAVALWVLLGSGAFWVVPVGIALAIAGVWVSYFSSDKLVLAMTKARVIGHTDAPQLYNLVEEVALAAGLPMPKVAIVDDPAPNAFATGRDPDHAVIAFTTGILQSMDREQLQGVAAHEMSHVGNRDTLVMAVAATTAGLVAIISDLGTRALIFNRRGPDTSNPAALIASLVVLLLLPLAALLLKASVSRKREALADATAVEITRNPTGLRRALESLQGDSTVVASRSTSVSHLWIESPLDGRQRSWFNTHPPIAERIDTLRRMEGLDTTSGK